MGELSLGRGNPWAPPPLCMKPCLRCLLIGSNIFSSLVGLAFSINFLSWLRIMLAHSRLAKHLKVFLPWYLFLHTMELLIKAIPDLGTPLLWYKSIPGIRSPLKFHSSAASTKPSNRPKQAHGAWADSRGPRPCKKKKKLLQCERV